VRERDETVGAFPLAPGRAGGDRSAGVAGPVESNIAELTQTIEEESEKRSRGRGAWDASGVGRLTALAFVLIIGKRKGSVWASR